MEFTMKVKKRQKSLQSVWDESSRKMHDMMSLIIQRNVIYGGFHIGGGIASTREGQFATTSGGVLIWQTDPEKERGGTCRPDGPCYIDAEGYESYMFKHNRGFRKVVVHPGGAVIKTYLRTCNA